MGLILAKFLLVEPTRPRIDIQSLRGCSSYDSAVSWLIFQVFRDDRCSLFYFRQPSTLFLHFIRVVRDEPSRTSP